MYDFSNKRVLVTGGSRGIGRAVSVAFARQNACVAINYLSNHDAANDTLADLQGNGHVVLQADIAKPDSAKKLVDETIGSLGGLDIVVNNAGIGTYHLIEDTDYETWQAMWKETIALNLSAPANISYCAARYMMEHGGGRIINISSRGAFRGEPNKPAYGASKAGLNAMGQSLAVALAPYNIFVGTVAPGFVETELSADVLNGPEGKGIKAQSPFSRVAKPEEVAHAVLFLASEGAEFSTGTIIDVNGASYLRT